MVGQPWDRISGESGKAYEAFVAYRDMGLTRSVRGVAVVIGKSRTLCDRWSSKWDWVNRAHQWDAHLGKERDKAWELAVVAPADELAEMNRRHAQMALDLQVKALDALRLIEPASLSAKDVLAYLVEATKLERQARGQPEQTEEEDVADQEIVIQLLADPDTRRMAATLATRVSLPRRAPSANGNGHHANGNGE